MRKQERNLIADEDEDLDEDLEDDSDTDSDDDNTDNIGEVSVEIDVDELISEMKSAGLDTSHLTGSCGRRRMEEIMEQRRISRELMDFEDFDLDND